MLYVDFQGTWFRKYRYYVFDLYSPFDAGQEGNYIFARGYDAKWEPLFVGEGDLHTAANYSPELKCALAKGVTHFLAHTNPNPKARKDEVKDLLKKMPICYEPRGCNRREAS